MKLKKLQETGEFQIFYQSRLETSQITNVKPSYGRRTNVPCLNEAEKWYLVLVMNGAGMQHTGVREIVLGFHTGGRSDHARGLPIRPSSQLQDPKEIWLSPN